MTTIKTFDGAVLVLTDATNSAAIAQRIADGYFHDSEYHFRVTESTPTNLPVDLFDQIDSKLKDSPAGSVVLTVYPWAESTL
jgi:hypothetical protein